MGTMRTERRDGGFTLIELLVVMIILAILSAIAVPTFMRQRQHAWRVAAQADVRQGAIEAELYYAEWDTYAGLDTVDLPSSEDNVLTVTDADAAAYCLEADHKKLGPAPDYHFDLDLGRPAQGAC